MLRRIDKRDTFSMMVSDNDVDDIIATLQLIGSVYESARKLGHEHSTSVMDIKNIYEKNVDKFAPYVLNY